MANNTEGFSFVFKLVKDGKDFQIDRVCVAGTDKAEAEKEARGIMLKRARKWPDEIVTTHCEKIGETKFHICMIRMWLSLRMHLMETLLMSEISHTYLRMSSPMELFPIMRMMRSAWQYIPPQERLFLCLCFQMTLNT